MNFWGAGWISNGKLLCQAVKYRTKEKMVQKIAEWITKLLMCEYLSSNWKGVGNVDSNMDQTGY